MEAHICNLAFGRLSKRGTVVPGQPEPAWHPPLPSLEKRRNQLWLERNFMWLEGEIQNSIPLKKAGNKVFGLWAQTFPTPHAPKKSQTFCPVPYRATVHVHSWPVSSLSVLLPRPGIAIGRRQLKAEVIAQGSNGPGEMAQSFRGPRFDLQLPCSCLRASAISLSGDLMPPSALCGPHCTRCVDIQAEHPST